MRIRINHYLIPETGPTKNVDIFLLHVIYGHDEVYVLLVESVVSQGVGWSIRRKGGALKKNCSLVISNNRVQIDGVKKIQVFSNK